MVDRGASPRGRPRGGELLGSGRSSMGLRVAVVGVVALAAVIAALAITARLRDPALRRATAARLAAATPAIRSDGGYVGSDACVACHPEEHGSWAATYHRTMTQRATPAAVLAPFDGRELGDADALAGPARVERRGDEFWVEIRDPEGLLAAARGEPAAAELPRVWRQVVMTTGSHHLQVYWVTSRDGRRLHAFPYSYLIADARWVANESTLLRPPGGDAVYTWNQVCIQCHAVAGIPGPWDDARIDVSSDSINSLDKTWSSGQITASERTDPIEKNSASAVAELGIACEACHGPGAEHLAAHRSPLARYRRHLFAGGGGDPTIVHPARLPAAASAEICGQCHSAAIFADEAAWQREGPRYRPGDRLEPELRLIRHPLRDGAPGEHWLDQRLTDDPGFLEGRLWGDGSVRVIGREYSGLRESPCFGGGEFSCLSCHQLHGAPADDQLAPGMTGDAACTRCHPAYASAAAAAAHSHHPASSAGSRCYNCHMPHATYGLLKASRNHEVDTPVASETLVGVRPNACNLCHLDRPLEWVGEHLERWYGIAAPEVEADARGIAAGLAWALQGDASQRALIAWHFGWEPAQAASGATWTPPILAILLDDPYDAVRFIAGRALGSIAGYDDLAAAYDYVGPAAERAAIARAVTERWQTRGDPHGDPRRDPALLRDADGALRAEAVAARLAARDDRPIDLRE